MRILVKTFVYLIGLALFGALAFGFYMAGRSYELANTVSLQQPYDIDPSISGFHADMFVADLHADTFTFVDTFMTRKDYAHLDFERAREGGFSLLTMAIATEVPLAMVRRKPEGVERGGNLIQIGSIAALEPLSNWFSLYARGNWVIDNIEAVADENPDQLVMVKYREDLENLLKLQQENGTNQLGLLLAVEGAHVLEGEQARLDELYARGVRMLSLTHAFDNTYGGSSEGIERYGITEEGLQLLERAQNLGIIIDLAHASPELVDDLLARLETPAVYSHGGVSGTCDIDRNLRDAALPKIKANGGLVAIGFWDRVLCGDTPADIAATMRHVADQIGAEHLAIGSDFDGGVKTVFDATGLPLLTDALLDEGFSDLEIRGIMGENYVQLLLSSLPSREL